MIATASGNCGVYPWQQGTWENLTNNFDRLPHALLFAGPSGLGKRDFAGYFAQAMLCQQPDNKREPCGVCKSCRLFLAGTHPDFTEIAPEETGKVITVDQIRVLVSFLSLRPHIAGRRLIIIQPAEAMNINAANSLLKLLEEPPLGNILILVSHAPNRLPATVRSRCSRIAFKPPVRQQASNWLADHVAQADSERLLDLAGGAPLSAVRLAESDFLKQRDQLLLDIEDLATEQADPIACAARWKKIGVDTCLPWLHGVTADMIKLMMSPTTAVKLNNPDTIPRLQALIKRLNLKELFRFVDMLTKIQGHLSGPLDELLLIEDSLICWMKINRNVK